MSSHSEHGAHKVAEVVMGSVQELAHRAGLNAGHTHGAAKVGELLVKGTAVVAPGVVATASGATAAAMGGLASGAAPAAIVLGAGYGAYRLFKWLNS